MDIGFLTVLITVFALVALAVPGFLLGKFKMLPENATKAFTTFLLYACQPALTFMSFQKTNYENGIVEDMLFSALLALVAHVVMIIIVLLIFNGKKGDKHFNVVKFASVFGNVGYMGLPFLQMLFPGMPKVLIFGAVIIAVFNLLNWTIGIYMLTGDKKFISLKKAIINPPFLAMIIALPLFLILKKPISMVGTGVINDILSKLMSSVNFLGDMVTPLSMAILGLRLSEMNIKEIFVNSYAYISSTMKLIVSPLITTAMCLLLLALGVSEYVTYAVFFTMAMPSATSSLLLSEQFGGEPHTASACVLFSTIACIVTIPLTYLLLNNLAALIV